MDLTVGKESTLIMKFALPMLLGSVFQQLYMIVDSVILGHEIGPKALAAVGSSFPIIFILISFIIGIASGSTIIIAQYFGAKDVNNVKRTIDTLYIFLFFASILVTVLGLVFSGFVFRLIKLPEEIIPQAQLYLNIYFAGIVLLFGFNGTSAILRGLGDSKTPLYFLIIATITNIVLDLLFIVVFKWGIAGAAVATLIAHGVSFLAAIIYLNKTHQIINLSIRKLVFDKGIFQKSLKIGLPSGFQQTFVALGMIALFRIVNDYGTNVIAAYSVAMRIDTFIAMPAMAFAMAISTFVGQNLGANKPDRVRKGFRATLLMASTVSVSVTIAVVLLSKPLMSMFTNDPDVIRIGANYLVIVSSFYVVFSTMFVIGGVMRGAGATLIPMFITLFALWIVRIPVSYFLSEEFGVIGIWWGVPAGWAIGALFSYIYYLTGKWKSKVVVKYN